MGCAIGTVRYILFFFNFLLALAGLGILILGLGMAYSKDSTTGNMDIVHGQLTTAAMMFSIVGACIFVFAFFGCWGALRENHCMICTYAVLLLTLFLLQLAVAVLAFTYRDKSKEVITQELVKRFAKYNEDPDTRIWVDSLQQEFQCCGSTDPQTPWKTLGDTPSTCYPGKNKSNPEFDKGCAPFLISMVETSLSQITKVAITVAVVQVVGIVFALCLANSIRRSELRGYA